MTPLPAPLPLFLALVLGTAAVHKLVAQPRVAAAAAALVGTGRAPGQVLALAAATLEALAAIALLLPATRVLGAGLAMALWSAYGAALVLAHRRGGAADCGCSFGAAPKPVDTFALLRAPLLVLLATLVALAPAIAPFSVEAPFAALALFALYFAAGELAALPTPRRSPA
jgi:Methylamine utilisation protein MauE